VNLVLSLLAFAMIALASAAPALAYVGPGAGLSLVGAFWGLLVAVFAAFAFVILWPLRRMFRRRRVAPADAVTQTPTTAAPLPSDQRNA
jgi:membrane protein implicated in regulation of membrane protease activity